MAAAESNVCLPEEAHSYEVPRSRLKIREGETSMLG